MIIKFLKRKKRAKNSARSALDYCLSNFDHKGDRREVEPKLLRGDVELMKQLDKIGAQYSNPVTSLVIAFRDDEDLDEQQKEKLLDDFLSVYVGDDMIDKAHYAVVEHRDKGNLEFHIVIHNFIFNENSKPMHFNPAPPGHERKTALFVALKNDELGFKQVPNNGLDFSEEKGVLFNNYKLKALTNDEIKGLAKKGCKTLELKSAINSFLDDKILKGEINSREELIDYLEKSGIEIERVTDKSITIKNPDPKKNMRSSIKLEGIKVIKGVDYDTVREYIKKTGTQKVDNDKRVYCVNALNNILKDEVEERNKRFKKNDEYSNKFIDSTKERVNELIREEKNVIKKVEEFVDGQKESKEKLIEQLSKKGFFKNEGVGVVRGGAMSSHNLAQSGEVVNRNYTGDICNCNEEDCSICFPDSPRMRL